MPTPEDAIEQPPAAKPFRAVDTTGALVWSKVFKCDACLTDTSGNACLITKGGAFGNAIFLTYILCSCTTNNLLNALNNCSFFKQSETHNAEPLHSQLHMLLCSLSGWPNWSGTTGRAHAHIEFRSVQDAERAGLVFCKFMIQHTNSTKVVNDIVLSIGTEYAKAYGTDELPFEHLSKQYRMYAKIYK